MASEYAARIRALAAEARRARRVEPGAGEPDVDRDGGDAEPGPEPAPSSDPDGTSLAAARDGLGPVVALYVEARSAERGVRFSADELDLLGRAASDWLAVYAARHGVAVDPDVTVREAAELLVETHDVVDVAALLTGVPED